MINIFEIIVLARNDANDNPHLYLMFPEMVIYIGKTTTPHTDLVELQINIIVKGPGAVYLQDNEVEKLEKLNFLKLTIPEGIQIIKALIKDTPEAEKQFQAVRFLLRGIL